MKIPTSLRIVFAGALLAALGACAMYPKSGQSALVGTWTNSFGTVWMIDADGTFSVDLNHDGKPDVRGKYTVSGDSMTMSEVKGKTPKGCKNPATYKFNRTDAKNDCRNVGRQLRYCHQRRAAARARTKITDRQIAHRPLLLRPLCCVRESLREQIEIETKFGRLHIDRFLFRCE